MSIPVPNPPVSNPATRTSGHGNSGTTWADNLAVYPGIAADIAKLHFDTSQDYRDSKFRKRHPNRPIRVVDPKMM
jgi:hypothetical protein